MTRRRRINSRWRRRTRGHSLGLRPRPTTRATPFGRVANGRPRGAARPLAWGAGVRQTHWQHASVGKGSIPNHKKPDRSKNGYGRERAGVGESKCGVVLCVFPLGNRVRSVANSRRLLTQPRLKMSPTADVPSMSRRWVPIGWSTSSARPPTPPRASPQGPKWATCSARPPTHPRAAPG